MPRIIQIVDNDSFGVKVRMNDGQFLVIPHTDACVPCVGEELHRDADGHLSTVPGGLPHLTVERANAPEQVVANVLSQAVHDSGANPTERSAQREQPEQEHGRPEAPE